MLYLKTSGFFESDYILYQNSKKNREFILPPEGRAQWISLKMGDSIRRNIRRKKSGVARGNPAQYIVRVTVLIFCA